MTIFKNMNWMSILGLCLITIGTILSFFGSNFSDEKGQKNLTSKIQEKNETIEEIKGTNNQLLSQNSSLIKSSEATSKTNKNLIQQNTSLIKSNTLISENNENLASQNTEMLSKISNYQKDLEDRNKIIRQLEKDISNIKEYSSYAKMDLYGLEMSAGDGITIKTDLSVRMEKVLIKKGNQAFVKVDKANIPILEEIIKKYPNFPFGYCATATAVIRCSSAILNFSNRLTLYHA